MTEGFEIRWYKSHDKYALDSWLVQIGRVYPFIERVPLSEGAGRGYEHTVVTDRKLSTWYE